MRRIERVARNVYSNEEEWKSGKLASVLELANFCSLLPVVVVVAESVASYTQSLSGILKQTNKLKVELLASWTFEKEQVTCATQTIPARLSNVYLAAVIASVVESLFLSCTNKTDHLARRFWNKNESLPARRLSLLKLKTGQTHRLSSCARQPAL